MKLLSLIVYIPLQILFLPLAIIGVVLVSYRQLVVSKKLGVSQTAIEVLNGRWTMHIFGMRTDEPTARLAAALPNTSLTGLWLVLFPLWLKHKISGQLFLYPRVPEPGHEGLGEIMVGRTPLFDGIISRATPDIEQFVVMGAGYDMRAYGDLKTSPVTCYELDQPNVQAHKREALLSAGIDSGHVRFVSVDFQQDDPFEKLVEAGFDPAKKSLFLWEGVTLYLSEDAVRGTMQKLAHNAPAGSILAADIYANRFVEANKKGATKAVLDYTDEGLGFGLPFEAGHEQVLRAFVESEGFTLAGSHFLGHAHAKGPFMAVAEMRS